MRRNAQSQLSQTNRTTNSVFGVQPATQRRAQKKKSPQKETSKNKTVPIKKYQSTEEIKADNANETFGGLVQINETQRSGLTTNNYVSKEHSSSYPSGAGSPHSRSRRMPEVIN